MEYRFLWEESEHRALYRALQDDVRQRSRLRWVIPLAFTLISLAALLAAFAAQRSGESVIGRLIPYVVLLVVWIGIFVVGMPYLSARAYKSAHAPCIPHDQIRSITADGIEARCVTSTVQVRWSGIVRVLETPKFFLFFTAPGCAIQVPKRVVPAAELPTLRANLAGLVGVRAELFSQTVS